MTADLHNARPPRTTFRNTSVAASAMWLLLLIGGPLLAEPISVQEFMAREPQFSQLVGAVFQIEGRASTFTGDELRMRGSDFKFLCQQRQERPRSFPQVQLVGRLERDAKGFHLVVTSLSSYKSEQDVIRERLRQGDTNNPQLYYDQAQWAENRGEFYQDEALRAEARRLRTLGIQAAARRTEPDRAEEFLALADRVTQWRLEDTLRMELLHATTRADLQRETKNRQPSYAAVLNKVRTRFPGSDQPLGELPRQTFEEYQRRPREVYAAADVDQRQVLERLLFIETALKLAEFDLRPDGSNGAAVAATVERLIPERPDLPARYREAEFAYLESNATRLDRAAVLELRDRLRQADQSDRATDVVRRWIDQQLRLRPKNPATDVDRAELEFEMAQDKDRALALVASALKVDPQVNGGHELLALMGYGWHEGRPVLKELIPPPPPDPFAKAIQEGRILPGMTDMQVRAALGGEPDSIVRLASQGRATELWHYPAQRLTLHLDSTHQKPRLVVSRIVEARAPRR